MASELSWRSQDLRNEHFVHYNQRDIPTYENPRYTWRQHEPVQQDAWAKRDVVTTQRSSFNFLTTRKPKLSLASAVLGHLSHDFLRDIKAKSKAQNIRRVNQSRQSEIVDVCRLQKRLKEPSIMGSYQLHNRPSIEEIELKQQLRTHEEMRLDDDELRRRMRLCSDFCYFDRVELSLPEVNIVEGIKLWTDFLTVSEQNNLLGVIDNWERKGEDGGLAGATFVAPKKWMKGKGRRTLQFGCCYNYAKDSKERPPGILADEIVEPMPAVLNAIAERLVRWEIVPPHLRPDSAIINIYSEGDCIPPHIDNPQFLRPFVTISLLSEAPISFGLKITAVGPGSFDAPFHIPLPEGSCLVLEGNGADVAKHCVSAVEKRRVSITLRKMDPLFAPNAMQ